MKTSTVFVRSLLATLVLVVIVVLSLEVASLNAAPPPVAAKSTAETAKPDNERNPKHADSAGTRQLPGIYTASPSIGIVVIPAPADKSFEKLVGPGVKMPAFIPPLQLTPRSAERPLSRGR